MSGRRREEAEATTKFVLIHLGVVTDVQVGGDDGQWGATAHRATTAGFVASNDR